jgi:TetR/AcrR family acrAB operon transcriptional repressor
MRRTKEEADQTRQDLLNAALTIFSQKGYTASRLEDIAQVAGVTSGAIYHHFGSKSEMYMALIEDAATVGNAAIARAMKEGGTFLNVITRILVNTFSLIEENQRFREVMALQFTTPENEEPARRRYEETQILVKSLSEFFLSGTQQGELRPNLNPETAARAFLGYQNVLSMLWLSNREAFSIKKSAAALAEIFVQGIARE